MAVYLREQLAAAWATDADRTQMLLSRSIDETVSTLDRAVVQYIEVAAGESRQVDLGSMTQPVSLWIETPASINVRTDASDGSAQVVAPLVTGGIGRLIKSGAITGVWLENEGAAAVVVLVAVAGVE